MMTRELNKNEQNLLQALEERFGSGFFNFQVVGERIQIGSSEYMEMLHEIDVTTQTQIKRFQQDAEVLGYSDPDKYLNDKMADNNFLRQHLFLDVDAQRYKVEKHESPRYTIFLCGLSIKHNQGFIKIKRKYLMSQASNKTMYYKYTNRTYLEDMLLHGQVKVGTLYEYRGKYDKAEIEANWELKKRVNTEIYDPNEGKVSLTSKVDKLQYKQGSPYPAYYRKFIEIDPFSRSKNPNPDTTLDLYYNPDLAQEHERTSDFTIENSFFAIGDEAPNALLYCVNKVPSEAAMRHFKCDVCIEISDIDLFVSAIGLQLFKEGLITGEKPYYTSCFYDGHEIQYDNRSMLYWHTGGSCSRVDRTSWLKDEDYSHQLEHRIVYPSKNKSAGLESTIIRVPEITGIIREHKF